MSDLMTAHPDRFLAARMVRVDEAALRRSETSRLVQLVLDRLPGRYGDALEWKYIDGLSVAEIAERLGVGVKAAESTLTRARSAFRDAFTAVYGGRWSEAEV